MALTAHQTKIARRQDLLTEIFLALCDHVGADFDHLELSSAVLYNVVVSYFHDVERHKEFHGTDLVDETKQGAFTMKWISKLRPIQITCSVEDVSTNILYINEAFAVRCGLAFLRVSPDVLPRRLYADLLYTLRYRPVDERMLLVWLSTLKYAIKGDFPQADG